MSTVSIQQIHPDVAERHDVSGHLHIVDDDGVQPLAIDTTVGPHGVRLAVAGELDVSTASQFGHAVSAAVMSDTSVGLDLRNVTFIDSSGLVALLHSWTDAGGRADLTIVDASPSVRRLLELTNLQAKFGLEDPESPVDTTQALLAHLVRCVPGCTTASILRVQRGVPITTDAVNHVARASDAAQVASDAGPSLAAIRRCETIALDRIVGGPGRYEEFRAAAASLGIESMVAVPVRTEDRTTIAVNLYADRPGAMDVRAIDDVLDQRLPSLGWARGDVTDHS